MTLSTGKKKVEEREGRPYNKRKDTGGISPLKCKKTLRFQKLQSTRCFVVSMCVRSMGFLFFKIYIYACCLNVCLCTMVWVPGAAEPKEDIESLNLWLQKVISCLWVRTEPSLQSQNLNFEEGGEKLSEH